MSPRKRSDQAKGCGCLLLVLVPISMLYSCLKGPDEPATSAAPLPALSVPPTTLISPTTPTAFSPAPTTSPGRAATTTRTTPRGTPKPQPRPDPDPEPEPNTRRTTTTSSDDGGGAPVYYANCDAVQAAGAAPIRRGDPGYRTGLDRDKDGVGCAGD